MKFFLGVWLGLALGNANADGALLFAWMVLAVSIPAAAVMGWWAWKLRKERVHREQRG